MPDTRTAAAKTDFGLKSASEPLRAVRAAKFAKSDVGYWRDKLTTRSNDGLHVRIRFGGVQNWWPLKMVNRDAAAQKARDIWKSLQAHGFAETEKKFKPWTVKPAPKPEILTVGEFITSAKAVAGHVRLTTFTTYERKLRFLVSQIAKVKGTKARHDHFHGGAVKWREGVDKIPLSELTANRIEEWRGRYLARFDDQPLKRQQAQSTAISIIRNAKALFSPRILKVLGADVIARLPTPLPFAAVEVGKRPRNRYKSKVNPGELTAAAWRELRVQEPDQFKIFLLALGAGLRRGEIDRLTWSAFDWQRGTVSIEPTEYGIAKTESSHDEIDLGQDLLDYFKTEKENASGEFVIGTATSTTIAPHWNHYRCDCTFKKLLDWLRKQGVTAKNPLHTLRKEFGSLINQKFGIYAASSALRHSNIGITRDAYVDKRERHTVNLSEMIPQTTPEPPKEQK
jgi:integrase